MKIRFELDGVVYLVDLKAYDTDSFVLPDKRIVDVDMWAETNPPKAIDYRVDNSFVNDERTPEQLSTLLDYPLARTEQ
jgi:hypothetical protein